MRFFILIIGLLPFFSSAQIISPTDEQTDEPTDYSKSFSKDSTEWLINVATTRRINGSRYSDFVIDKKGNAHISSFEMRDDMQEYAMLYSVSENGQTVFKNEMGSGRLYGISTTNDNLIFGGDIVSTQIDSLNPNKKVVAFKSDVALKDKKEINAFGKMTIHNISSDESGNYYLCGDGSERIRFGEQVVDLGEKGQFIVKINSKNVCEWIRPILSNAIVSRIECDKKGQVWISGHFFGIISFCGKNYETTDDFDADGFLFALDTNGALIFSQILGSFGQQKYGYRSDDKISFITTDKNGNIHFVGVLDGQTFIEDKPFGKNGFKQFYHGKVNTETLELSSIQLLGESQNKIEVFSIVVDENENLYITGTAINGTIGTAKVWNRKPFTCFIVKFDRKMEMVWFKRCENTDATIRCLQIYGHFLYASGHYRSQLLIENQQIRSSNAHELFLLKLKK